MMVAMQSTTAQFGGFIFSTDNDQHPILSTAQRLMDVWVLVGVQVNILLMTAVPAFDGLNKLCLRLLAWMDLIEVGLLWAGDVIEAGLEGCAVVFECFMLIIQLFRDVWLVVTRPLVATG